MKKIKAVIHKAKYKGVTIRLSPGMSPLREFIEPVEMNPRY
ncbi:MAG: hypothetical protein V2I47_02290 [Bacteroidales bacterium]|nr:hypothetical protein [Bacteroidales bacterium]